MEELKDIFTLHKNTDCQTHELINCQCNGTEVETVLQDELDVDVRNYQVGSSSESEKKVKRHKLSQVQKLLRFYLELTWSDSLDGMGTSKWRFFFVDSTSDRKLSRNLFFWRSKFRILHHARC